jgi:Zn-finger protein
MDARTFVIDCDDCAMQHSDACADCVVTFLCERTPGEAVVIDADEARAVRLLSRAGLAPDLRHHRRVG